MIDIAPTVLEAAGLPEPTTVHGVEQKPMEGVSMLYAFDDAEAAERRTTQYFEMFCNRGIYHEGWTAVTRHSTPWVLTVELPAFDDDVWELYDTNDRLEPGPRPRGGDAREARRAAAALARRGGQVQRAPARRPADRALQPRPRRAAAARSEGSSQLLFGGMGRLSENSVINIKNKSHSVTAELEVPDGGAEGVIISQGGAFAGWSLYVKDGKPKYAYNFLGLQRFTIDGDARSRRGSTRCGWSSPTTAAGWPRAAPSRSTSTATRSGEGRVEATVPMVFSADETCDIGSDTASPVTPDYTPETSHFTGKVDWVQIDIDAAAEDVDHLIIPRGAPPDRDGPPVAWPDPAARPRAAGPPRAGRELVIVRGDGEKPTSCCSTAALRDGQRGSLGVSRGR